MTSSDQQATQLRECCCGTLTTSETCLDCGAHPVPVWECYTPGGRCVGYVLGYSGADAVESVSQSPQFDRYQAIQPRPCYRTPEQGPIPEIKECSHD